MPAHWWATLSELAAFAAIFVLSFGPLRKYEKATSVILKIIGTYILAYKLAEYGTYVLRGAVNSLPIDFSAVTYFVFGFSVWTPFKTFKKIAASAAFLTGFIYSLAFIMFTEVFFAKAPEQYYLFVAATTNHTLMLFAALLALSLFRLERLDAIKIPLGFSLFVLYAYVAVEVAHVSTTAVIFDIVEGRILSYAFKNIVYNVGFYAAYYICCVVALEVVIALLFYLNRRLFKPQVFLDKRAGNNFKFPTFYSAADM